MSITPKTKDLVPPLGALELRELLHVAEVSHTELDLYFDSRKGWLIGHTKRADRAFDRITRILYATPGLWEDMRDAFQGFEEEGRWLDLEQLAFDWHDYQKLAVRRAVALSEYEYAE